MVVKRRGVLVVEGCEEYGSGVGVGNALRTRKSQHQVSWACVLIRREWSI